MRGASLPSWGPLGCWALCWAGVYPAAGELVSDAELPALGEMRGTRPAASNQSWGDSDSGGNPADRAEPQGSQWLGFGLVGGFQTRAGSQEGG